MKATILVLKVGIMMTIGWIGIWTFILFASFIQIKSLGG